LMLALALWSVVSIVVREPVAPAEG